MADQNLNMNCRDRTLSWPDGAPTLAKFSPSIELPPLCWNSGKVDPEVQKDVERRDKLMAEKEKKYQILHRSWRQPKQMQHE